PSCRYGAVPDPVGGAWKNIHGQNTDNRRTARPASAHLAHPSVRRKPLVDATIRDDAEEGNRTPKPLRAGGLQPSGLSLYSAPSWRGAEVAALEVTTCGKTCGCPSGPMPRSPGSSRS